MTPKAPDNLGPPHLPSSAMGLSPMPTLQADNADLYSVAGPWQSQALLDAWIYIRCAFYWEGSSSYFYAWMTPINQVPAESVFLRVAFFKHFLLSQTQILSIPVVLYLFHSSSHS